MTASIREIPVRESLDRASWHRPLVSIIMTHHNYSDFIHDAILSVLDQTHENWEIVVVDDASSAEHRQKLESILAEIDHPRISSVFLADNVGQVLAFYAGFDKTKGDFVCLLDPDDRYAETFIEESLAAHLNPWVSCPVVSTDQYLCTKNGLISGLYVVSEEFRQAASSGDVVEIERPAAVPYFIPSSKQGWHWTTTSTLMFRRSALVSLRPSSPLPFRRAFDAYTAQGAHLLGGSIFLPKPLVYRMIHERNSWHTNQFFSSLQRRDNVRAANVAEIANDFARQVLASKGIELPRSMTKLTTLARWKRSIMKRLPKHWVAGRQAK